ncbi:MAG: DMT family transporter [Actinobacteria bacterium]|nr:DMT family transporter [Actinomycetota bacterium]NDH88566.1 DMT family transporter [Actinomycetota bacterium]NDH95992.1 DMT family transporter [Actinomycetota bacterium]
MAITLALLTAALFGTGDFLGGLAGKRMSVLRVLAISHTIGLVLITIGAVVIADEFLLRDLAWGALAGIAGFIGLALLYRGLARGPMGVVAPLTAITSAAVPAGWGLLIDDESLAGTAWIGVVVALLAIGLASASPIEQSSVSLAAIVEALLAGVGFGLMFVGLDQTVEASAPWPVVGGRLMTVSAMAVFFFIVKRESPLPSVRADIRLPAIAGLVDTFSNALFLYATLEGDLAIVAVLSSLYPIATVILARLVLGERLTRLQQSGFVAAMVATTLIAI